MKIGSIDDGRNFLLKSTEKYDVITMEPMPLVLSPEKYSERLRSEKLVRDLSLINLSAPDQMAGTFLMDRDALLDLAFTRYARPALPYLREGSGPFFEQMVATLKTTYEQLRHIILHGRGSSSRTSAVNPGFNS
jgi:hypothetical protein